MKKRRLVLLLLIFGYQPIFYAQSPLNTSKFIVFYCRPPRLVPFSIGGHAFVSWVQMDGSRMVDELTFGFYPKNSTAVSTLVLPTEGKVVEGFNRNWDGNLSLKAFEVAVPDSIFFKTMQAARDLNKSTYRLFSKNCLALMDKTAKGIHLKTPSTRVLLIFPKSPIRYLRQLKRKNRASFSKN